MSPLSEIAAAGIKAGTAINSTSPLPDGPLPKGSLPMKRLPLYLLSSILYLLASSAIAADVPPPESGDPGHLKAACLAKGCSATIISKGPEWACGVTAAHCFNREKPGDKFPVRFLDGTQAEGMLLSIDREYDQIRFAVPSGYVLGVAPVALGIPDKARYEAIGFPGRDSSRRPYYFLLAPAAQSVVNLPGEQFSRPTPRWAFRVDNGGATPGVSGTGILANGQLCGILSNNNGHQVATHCYTSTPEQLVRFLKLSDAAGCDKWKMGEWGAPPCRFDEAPQPLAYADQSNHPLFDVPSRAPARLIISGGGCQNGRCPLRPAPSPSPAAPLSTAGRSVSPEDPVPPPPDGGHQLHAQRLQRSPQESADDSEVYSGHGRPPKDLRGRRHLAHEVDKLRHEEKQPGPPGKDGRDGKDLRSEILPDRQDAGGPPLLPLLLVGFLGFAVFLSVPIAALFLRFLVHTFRAAHA